MGLSNASKRARNYNLIINSNQGGGNKKFGSPYQIGRSSWSSIFLDTSTPGKCCTLSQQMTMKFTPSTYQARNTGGNAGVAAGYYKPY